jgi:hypothetical protein
MTDRVRRQDADNRTERDQQRAGRSDMWREWRENRGTR